MCSSLVVLTLCPKPALTEEYIPSKLPNESYSPYPEQHFPNRVLFGDTHLHTSYSADAGMIGNTLGPDEAYRFAKGETVFPPRVSGRA